MTETPDMPVLYVPDVYGHGYPGDEKSYNISAASRNLVDYQLLKTIIANWDALGSGKVSDVPKPGEVMQVTPISMTEMRSETMVNYSQKSDTLRKAFDTMQTAYVNVAEKVKAAKDERAAYQAKVGDLIDSLNAAAATPPESGMTEDDYIMAYVADGVTASAKTMQDTLDKQSENATTITDQAKTIDTLTKDLKDQKALTDKLQKEIDDLKKNGTGTGTGTGTGSYDPGAAQQVGTGTGTGTGTGSDEWSPIDLGADGTTGDGTSDGTGTGAGGSDGTGTGTGSSGSGGSDSSYPSSTTPVAATSPDSGLGSSMGSGMSDMMNSLGPMMQAMAQQQMMRDMMNQNGQNGQVQQQPAVAQPASVAPQPQPQTPANTAPAGAPGTTPPPGTSSSQPGQGQPGGPVPGHTPGADGMVDYTFPDGRTQKVSAVVAQALDAAFGNQSGTDAQAAYGKTAAKWSDKKQIGEPVDPNAMMTGDVAVWKDRTAVVVKFGTPDSGGTLEAVIGGKLQELTSDNLNQMSDSAGEFGEFTGFAHPHGIEAAAAGDQSGTAPGGAPTGDQSGAPMLAATGGASV